MEFVKALDSLLQFSLNLMSAPSLYNEFNDKLFHQWLKDNEYKLWLTILLYLIAIYICPKLTQNLKPVSITSTVVLWNSAVAVFHIIVGIFTFMERYEMITLHGWKSSICRMQYYTGPIAFWSGTFVLSKLILFGDTLILLIRKRRKIMFSHWYHHISVLWATWDSYTNNQALCRWLGAINSWTLAALYGIVAVAIQFPNTRRFIAPFTPIIACIEVKSLLTFSSLLEKL